MHCGAQRIQVGTRICVALILFWWSISWRSQSRRLLSLDIFHFVRACDAKVYQVGSFVFCTDDNIGGFDVAMDNWWCLLFQVIEYVQQLRGYTQYLPLLHGLIHTIHTFFEILSLDVFLYHKIARILFEAVGYI